MAASYIGGSLHDLNAVDGPSGDIEGISDVERDAITEGSLDNDEESTSVDCIHESYSNSLPVHGAEVEDDRSGLENSGESSRSPSNMLTIDDVVPIETARARFLQVVVDHFLRDHVVEVVQAYEAEYNGGYDKVSKRKSREVQYEGDPRFVLPLMYVANLYETLVNDANARLASLAGVREKTIGVALEAAGGLYRRLAKKFPRKGPYGFKRRELATSLETRARFPELVQEEKTCPFRSGQWFKRLTGRGEASISERDYKFYSPRHKFRRAPSQAVSNLLETPQQNQQQPPMKHHGQLMQQLPFYPIQQPHHQPMHHQNQHTTPHFSQIAEIPLQSSATLPQHMACLQSLSGGHAGGRLHLLPTNPAKFCDECGAPYLRETSKFCSECGVKRLGT
ncbi:unnamed protein product [Spirodela intermedia]|uniref:Uncharacterized protein n=1 Tax=Spirodela intermedia TaxID=51605 RepID=A0A7I8J0A1_SPIIN|nr:unnamed protein product [Spirodela intermedia]CAA6662730.1 unnamed protein product [Spirodela intermedia]